MYIPSYDFGLFDIRNFSPLQAQEFGADTYFSANTPTSYVNFALNQLQGLTDPRNPYPYVSRSALRPAADIIPRELQQFFQQKDNITVYPSGQTPPELQHQGPPVRQTAIPKECTWFDKITGRCPAVTTDQATEIVVQDKIRRGIPEAQARAEAALEITETKTKIPTMNEMLLNIFGLDYQKVSIFTIAIVIVILLILFARR